MLRPQLALLMTVAVLLMATSVMAQEISSNSSNPQIQRADYLMNLGRFVEAREAYQDVAADNPGTDLVDKATVGIARSYMAENDFQTGITFLEDVLTSGSSMGGKEEAQTLYCNMERAFRNSRTRATQNLNSIQAEYDDISWFNIFKIFKKLDLRSDIKKAEKELQELSDLHNLFNTALLQPDAYTEPAVDPVEDTTTDDSGDEDTTDDETTDEDTDTDEEQTQDEIDRARAYEILQDDIARLIALVPEENQDEIPGIVDVDGEDATVVVSTPGAAIAVDTEEGTVSVKTDDVEIAVSVADDGLDETVDEELDTESLPSAPATTDTTSETVIGEDDVLVAVVDDKVDSVDEEPVTSTASVVADEITSSVGVEIVTSGTPAAADTTEEETEVAVVPATIGELKQGYITAYQAYIKAHQSGDPAAVREAMTAYRAALRSYQDAQNNVVSNESVTSGDEASDSPAAASTTGSESSTTDSGDQRVFTPSSNVVTDRLGRARTSTTSLNRSTTLQNSRRSFR